MRKLVAVLALVVLCLAGCEDTPPLTVQAYADQCAAISSDQPDPETFVKWGQWQQWLLDHVNAFRKLNPPTELADYHEAYLFGFTVLRDYLSGLDPNGVPYQSLTMARLRTAQTSHDQLSEAYAALPRDIRQILHETGCRKSRIASTD